MKNDLPISGKIPFPRKSINIVEKRDPTCSIKFSEISTLKKNQSKIENKIKIEQSLSEIKLEEVNSLNDQNITYLSMLKKEDKQKENNITNDEEVLKTNLSTKEKEDNPKLGIQINFSKIIEKSSKKDDETKKQRTFKTVKTINYLAHSQFSETSFVNGEEKLKNLVRKSKKNCNTSRSRTSSSRVYDSFLNKDNIIEIRNYETYSNFELSKIIFDILHQAQPETMIILPPRYISLPYIILTHPLIIRGMPGTLVEINNGSIIISNEMESEYKADDPRGKFYISECSFVFNLELNSFVEKVHNDEVINKNVTIKNGKYNLPLIKLENNVSLEIHDCDFRAILHKEENIIEGEENRIIYETCFQISQDDSKSPNKSELKLFSTICSNFYRVMFSENNRSIAMENCHFSDCVGNAIEIKNVGDLVLRNNIIANCSNAIKIEYDYSNLQISSSRLRIVENEITQNNKKGIWVSSCHNMQNAINFNFDLKFKSNLIVEILKNKLYQNKENAVSIENVFIDTLNISENEIKHNLDTGISLISIVFNDSYHRPSTIQKDISFYKAYDDESCLFVEKTTFNHEFVKFIENNDFNLVLCKNNIFENKHNRGILISGVKNCKLKAEGNILNKNLSGIEFVSQVKNSLWAYVINSVFSENLGEGILVSNCSLNHFLFKNCKFVNNFTYGLSLKNNEITRTDCKKGSGLKFDIPFVFLSDSELYLNKVGGVFLRNSYLNIEGCRIKDNTKWAVDIPLEINKSLIKFLNYEKKLDVMINNPIGGDWGTLGNKKSICSGSDGCLIM